LIASFDYIQTQQNIRYTWARSQNNVTLNVSVQL